MVLQEERVHHNQDMANVVLARAITERLNIRKAMEAPFGVQLQLVHGVVIPEYLKRQPDPALLVWQDIINAGDVLAVALNAAVVEIRDQHNHPVEIPRYV